MQHRFPLVTLLSSLLFIPVLFALRLLHGLFPMTIIAASAVFFVVSLVALYLVLTEPADHCPVLVLDKIFGLMLAFTAIPLTFKFVVVGFCAFHVLRVAMPFVSKRLFGFDFYRLGNVLHFLLPSLLAGALVNGVLRLVLWIAQ